MTKLLCGCAVATVAAAAAGALKTEKKIAQVQVDVDFGRETGRVKPLHGVNNAPLRMGEPKAGKPGKIWEFEEAGIPYMRTHDTAGPWGGTHFVDVPNIFPDFDADENDPANYDFTVTDAFLMSVVTAGTEIYYRLGVTFEMYHRVKTYTIDPPKDYAKWARICEHIVRHYNEGWADGFHWNIKYWEIWNEPENPPMWSGTKEQFFELYRVVANHLKGRFPEIKVGGFGGCGFYIVDDPSLRNNKYHQSILDWFETFCKFVTDEKTKAPLDFFSWHEYIETTPHRIAVHADFVRRKLDEAGLKRTESHFNEWNYVGRGWTDLKFMMTAKGAACMSETMCLLQRSPVDMAMYYDATPTRKYCGLFDMHESDQRTPTYFAFKLFNEVYKLGSCVESSACGADFGVVASRGADGRKAVLMVNNSGEPRRVKLSFKGAEKEIMELRLLDETHSSEEVFMRGAFEEFTLQPYMLALLETPGMYMKPASRVAEMIMFAGQDEAGFAERARGREVKRQEVKGR
ncbi:MAG: hypothetical protein J6T01_01390 [Kiritimatiellae bacterium]|nr:hypothetical protein [Kiritimatiellia bacterium]